MKIYKKTISTLVSEIIQLKQQSSATDTTALESEIDQLVYQLYELTAEKIEKIGSSIK